MSATLDPLALATPGPWRVCAVNETVVRSNGIDVCQVDGDYEVEYERMAADAQLISAAPDMLAALLKVQAWILRYHGPITCEPFTSVRAAIAKAGA